MWALSDALGNAYAKGDSTRKGESKLGTERLKYLDELVEEVAIDDLGRYDPLSTGERLYIALAANRADLFKTGRIHNYPGCG